MNTKLQTGTRIVSLLSMIALLLLSLIIIACGPAAGGGLTSEGGEHERDREGGKGEEDGTEYGLDDSYDVVRKGARLILQYDTNSNAFVGTVENTTEATLEQVRVEVHLSNGIELGPTNSKDLAPGEKIDVTLQATDESFEGWSPHAEVGRGEHGGEGGEYEGEGGEHEGEGGGEHGG